MKTPEITTIEEKKKFAQDFATCTGTLLSVLAANPEYDLEKSPAACNAIKNTLIALFADVCNTTGAAWKARVNNVVFFDGARAFLLVLNTPDGPIIEHIDEKYWTVFEVTEKTVTDKEAWAYSKKEFELPFEEAMRRFASLL